MLFLLKVGGEASTQYFMFICTYSFCLLAGPIINADYTLQMYNYYVVLLQKPIGRKVARHVQKEVSSVQSINNVQKLGNSC